MQEEKHKKMPGKICLTLVIKASETVSRVLSWTIIYLEFVLPRISSNLPEPSRADFLAQFGLASDGVYTALPVTG